MTTKRRASKGRVLPKARTFEQETITELLALERQRLDLRELAEREDHALAVDAAHRRQLLLDLLISVKDAVLPLVVSAISPRTNRPDFSTKPNGVHVPAAHTNGTA